MENVFLQITAIICLAAFLAIIFRVLKQPLILAYILTGLLIGPFGLFQFNESRDMLKVLGEFGITLLLFMLGLELKVSQLKTVGKTAFVASLLQMFLSFLFGFGLSLLLGFSQTHAFYIGIVLSFSSTIVVVKHLSDKKDLASLYGKITVGILLLQDVLAILVLLLLSGFSATGIQSFSFTTSLSFLFIKGFFIALFMLYVASRVIPHSLDAIANSDETLFLFSLAWVFGLAAFVSLPQIGFSIEVGGLLAGLSLSHAKESFQIVSRVKALRDFFITIFFVFLGSQMQFPTVSKMLLPAIVLSVLVIIGKPFIVTISLSLLGHGKRTAFFSAVPLGQISEFSLIVMFLAQKQGYVSNEIVSLITLVAIITFVISAYLMRFIHGLYAFLKPLLSVLETKSSYQEHIGAEQNLENHVLLIGAHRMGQSILEALNSSHHKVIVVDFDPDIVEDLKKQQIESFFGDISDLDIQEHVNLKSAKLVISTAPDIEDNTLLIKGLKRVNKKAKIIVAASDFKEAKQLYTEGADYVVMPHLAGGRHIAKLILENNLDQLSDLRLRDKKYLDYIQPY